MSLGMYNCTADIGQKRDQARDGRITVQSVVTEHTIAYIVDEKHLVCACELF